MLARVDDCVQSPCPRLQGLLLAIPCQRNDEERLHLGELLGLPAPTPGYCLALALDNLVERGFTISGI